MSRSTTPSPGASVRAGESSRERLSPQKMLSIYLNDHLAGATGGVQLSRRMARNDRQEETELRTLARDVHSDRKELLEIMRVLDVRVAWHKVALAWAAEKVGRLKLNGRLLRASPLSSLLELEAMRLGVEGKAAGWRSLRVRAGRDRRLDVDRLDELLARAQRQIDKLESLHTQAASEVFEEEPRGGT